LRPALQLIVLNIPRETFELIDEQQRMHRRYLEALRTRLANHLVVHPNQVVSQFRELRPVALIRALGNAILLDTPYPADGVLVSPAAARAAESLGSGLGTVGEEGTFVEGHDGLYDQR
jgi:hypothetical protein